jgi:hypothetical protein
MFKAGDIVKDFKNIHNIKEGCLYGLVVRITPIAPNNKHYVDWFLTEEQCKNKPSIIAYFYSDELEKVS